QLSGVIIVEVSRSDRMTLHQLGEEFSVSRDLFVKFWDPLQIFLVQSRKAAFGDFSSDATLDTQGEQIASAAIGCVHLWRVIFIGNPPSLGPRQKAGKV